MRSHQYRVRVELLKIAGIPVENKVLEKMRFNVLCAKAWGGDMPKCLGQGGHCG